MKILLALFLVICIVSPYSEGTKSSASSKLIHEKYVECAAQNKIDQKSVIEHITKHNGFPNTPEVKCFLACIMKKDGMMSNDGKLTEKFAKVEKACSKISGKDACEIAFNAIECLSKNQPKPKTPRKTR